MAAVLALAALTVMLSTSLGGGISVRGDADGLFVVSDHTTVVAFDPTGGKVGARLPACYKPPTTSSEVDAQGRTLGYDEKGKRLSTVFIVEGVPCQ